MELIKAHEDNRRSIHIVDGLLNDNKEFSIIKLKKGKAIGGCKHSRIEYMCLLSGCIVTQLGDKDFVMFPGESKEILPYVPHMFVAEDDSIICEWGITTEEKENNKKDEKMLVLVNEINHV